ncbi:MAG: GrpB family protein, partial [Lachnospiraceae bacterium]|nr:GrpB family protein [Lachnospiraceae bacterium]
MKGELSEALGNLAFRIEHVGSTSVRGLSAKPIIDIDVVIKDMTIFDHVKEALSGIGYHHEGDLGIPGREAFKYEGKEHLRKHHLYVCPVDSPELRRHLKFRDYLRSHPEAVEEYGKIKEEGAALYPDDMDKYIAHKAPVIQSIYEKMNRKESVRPEFDTIKTYEEFSKYYWYRDELIAICKAHGLKAPSGKIELNRVIEAYFSGEMIRPEKSAGAAESGHEKKKRTPKKKTVTELTLETGLIECGFTFGPKFRDFFIRQTGVEKFKFNVDMVATAKAVKENGDESFTLGDLLDIYYGKKTYAIYDKSALQWNRFVHDFCADPAT